MSGVCCNSSTFKPISASSCRTLVPANGGANNYFGSSISSEGLNLLSCFSACTRRPQFVFVISAQRKRPRFVITNIVRIIWPCVSFLFKHMVLRHTWPRVGGDIAKIFLSRCMFTYIHMYGMATCRVFVCVCIDAAFVFLVAILVQALLRWAYFCCFFPAHPAQNINETCSGR